MPRKRTKPPHVAPIVYCWDPRYIEAYETGGEPLTYEAAFKAAAYEKAAYYAHLEGFHGEDGIELAKREGLEGIVYARREVVWAHAFHWHAVDLITDKRWSWPKTYRCRTCEKRVDCTRGVVQEHATPKMTRLCAGSGKFVGREVRSGEDGKRRKLCDIHKWTTKTRATRGRITWAQIVCQECGLPAGRAAVTGWILDTITSFGFVEESTNDERDTVRALAARYTITLQDLITRMEVRRVGPKTKKQVEGVADELLDLSYKRDRG